MADADLLAEWPPQVLDAVRRTAEFQADLVGNCLRALEDLIRNAGYPNGCSGLPKSYLFELAAILQLEHWELQGLRDLLPDDLPTAQNAKTELCNRAINEPLTLFESDHSTLALRVMQVCIENFHWLDPDLVEADIVISIADEEQVLDAVAKLIWAHRHDQ